MPLLAQLLMVRGHFGTRVTGLLIPLCSLKKKGVVRGQIIKTSNETVSVIINRGSCLPPCPLATAARGPERQVTAKSHKTRDAERKGKSVNKRQFQVCYLALDWGKWWLEMDSKKEQENNRKFWHKVIGGKRPPLLTAMQMFFGVRATSRIRRNFL